MMPPLSRARHCETPCPTPSSREGGLRLGGRAPRGRYGSLAPCCLPAPWRWRLRRHALHRCFPTAPSAPEAARRRPSSPSVSTTTRPTRCGTPGRLGRVREHHGHARARERQHARRDVDGHLDASSRQLAGDLPRIDLREPSTRPARWTDRHRDVAATDADAGTHPAADSDADPSTDRRTDANDPRSARRQRRGRRRRPEARRVHLPPVRSRRHRPMGTTTRPAPRAPRRRRVARATSSQALPVVIRRGIPTRTTLQSSLRKPPTRPTRTSPPRADRCSRHSSSSAER